MPPQLCIGIDIGKFRHLVGFVSADLLAQHCTFAQCPTVVLIPDRLHIDELLAKIALRLPLSECAVLLEHTGHYHRVLVEALHTAGLRVYVVAIKSRKASLDKTDKIDALRLANQIYNQLVLGSQVADPAQRIQDLHPPTPAAAQLDPLMRRRYELVQATTRTRNKLTAIADELFPELTQVPNFRDPNALIALDLRERFPTPAHVAAATIEELRVIRHWHFPTDARLQDLKDLAARSIGVTNPARSRGLQLEQAQLIAELRLFQRHLKALEGEIVQIVDAARDGQILRSIPCIGPIQAATILASIGSIDNFDSPAKLKKYFGWAPQSTQTGITLDRAHLTASGTRLMKSTLYLIALRAVKDDTPWRALYQRLIPQKCTYDARTGQYRGKLRVLGRICGQLTELIYTLLKRDADLLHRTPAGQPPPPPTLYDPTRPERKPKQPHIDKEPIVV